MPCLVLTTLAIYLLVPVWRCTFYLLFVTPIILYGVSLTIAGLYHIAVILKRGEQSNTHPFLWSLAVFALLALLAYLALGTSWSFLVPNQA